MRHIIPISGKDSLATALVQIKREPNLPYEFMFNPTGAELPEVFEWIDRVSKYLYKEIVFVGEDLKDIIAEYNYFLPSQQSRYCTRKSKIEPAEKFFGKDLCTVYFGIRSDENRGGYQNASGRITVVYPLKEENIDLNGVYEIINFHGLKPPTFFWQSVYDEVCRRLGEKLIKSILKEWQIDMLFAWRSRANCYFCFNQRLYEWVGLLEHHPDFFWEAESIEHKGSEKKYTFNSNRSLEWIAENKETIIKKRADFIVHSILKMMQGDLFLSNEKDVFDIFNSTSCGLFCGK